MVKGRQDQQFTGYIIDGKKKTKHRFGKKQKYQGETLLRVKEHYLNQYSNA